MTPRPREHAAIPSAPVSDLDLDVEEDEAEWERRVARLAQDRLDVARARLERLGVIDRDGALRSSERPADMADDADTSVETG